MAFPVHRTGWNNAPHRLSLNNYVVLTLHFLDIQPYRITSLFASATILLT